jgi:ABC-2 type transport system ATP-binding protein
VADGPLDEIRAKSGRVRYVVSIQESAGNKPYRGRGALPKKGEVEDALGKVNGVKKLSELPTDESAHAFEVVGEKDQDLRPDIFQLVAEKGWVLLELHRDQQTLEDVFRSLTIGDERRNRQIAPALSDEDDEDEDEDDEDDADESAAPSPEDKVAKADRS